MSDEPIYLDHNATTPLLPEVVDAMLPFLREHFGNPSSGHVYGQRARAAVEGARAQVASMLGCEPDEVLFTSGGTEANNLAIRGVAEAVPMRTRIVTSTIEHPATARPVAWLEERGWTVTRLAVSAEGQIDPLEPSAVRLEEACLVTVMHSNNETGVLQPIAPLAIRARTHGALVHTDAAQSAGKVPLDVKTLGVDLLSIAGHKLYAPKGVGALYVRRATPLKPLLLGAGHERGMRPGTENVASIVGLGVASEAAVRDLSTLSHQLTSLRDQLFERLAQAVPGLTLNGCERARLPNTLNVRFPAATGTAILARCPEVAASTGSACHDGAEAASGVLLAMGIAPDQAPGSVRLTLGRRTTAADIERAAALLAEAWKAASSAR